MNGYTNVRGNVSLKGTNIWNAWEDRGYPCMPCIFSQPSDWKYTGVIILLAWFRNRGNMHLIKNMASCIQITDTPAPRIHSYTPSLSLAWMQTTEISGKRDEGPLANCQSFLCQLAGYHVCLICGLQWHTHTRIHTPYQTPRQSRCGPSVRQRQEKSPKWWRSTDAFPLPGFVDDVETLVWMNEWLRWQREYTREGAKRLTHTTL